MRLLALLAAWLPLAAALPWAADMPTAQKTGKPILLFFTGSDWCQACQEFESAVLNAPAFEDAVGAQFAFVKVDLPLNTPLEPAKARENQELKKTYSIEGLPTLVVALPSGNSFTLAVSPQIPPIRLAEELQSDLKATQTFEKAMVDFQPASYSNEDLEDLYRTARMLDLPSQQQRILTAAMARQDQSLFFLRERYLILLQKGAKNSPEAKALRQKLLDSDPDGSLGIQLFIAVSDFEASGKQAGDASLNRFVKRFGDKQPQLAAKVRTLLDAHHHGRIYGHESPSHPQAQERK